MNRSKQLPLYSLLITCGTATCLVPHFSSSLLNTSTVHLTLEQAHACLQLSVI